MPPGQDAAALIWPNDILTDRAPLIARAVLALLSAGTDWRHRRVETVMVLSATRVRRRVSVDFCVPPEFHDGLCLPVEGTKTSDKDQYLVPLGWLARRQLVGFDLEDGGGKRLPMLLGSQTALLLRELLLQAALHANDDVDPKVIDVIADATNDAVAPDVQMLVGRAAEFELGDAFTSLVRASASGFLLFATLAQIEGRQVVKWATDELEQRAPALRSQVSIDVRVPGIGEAASTHVELVLPASLSAVSFRLMDLAEDPNAGAVPLPAGERGHSPVNERPRLLLGPVATARDPFVKADVVIEPSGFLAPALALAAVALLALVVGLASHVENIAPTASSTAPTILLGAFSVGFGLFLRSEEHLLIRDILAPARAALGWIAIALAAAAVPVAFHLPREWILGVWWCAVVVTVVALGTIGVTFANHTVQGRKYCS